MPAVLIEVMKAYTPDQEVALMEAVHSALRDAFKVPLNDRNVRLIAHEPHRWMYCPYGAKKERPESFTHISIDAFSGRSLDAKRKLYRTIVGNLEMLGVPKDHIEIVLRDVGRENWGIRGGQAACDVDLGFKVEI